jgi:alpha/beta superfamily hydrolase
MIPVVLPSPAGDCFAAYDQAPGPGVLVCPPFGHEALATARVWGELGRRLAARGIATLRPDLPGTGQSAGSPADPGRVTAWRGAIRAAADWLAERHEGRVILFGHRFGALLALDALAGGLAPEYLVLLDPPASGAAYARGLRARARIEGFGTPPEGPDFVQAWGVPLSAETLAGLASLPRAFAADAPLPPTLLLQGPAGGGGAGVQDWAERLRAAGAAAVTVAPFEGYDRFVGAEDLEAEQPDTMLDCVVEHLAGAVRPAAARPVRAMPPLPMPAGIMAPGFREEPLRFGAEGCLFGLLCRPERAVPEAPAVLLPSVAALPCSGPARMWTELARRLAMHGIASLRFDMAGVAESDGGLPAEDGFVAAYHPDRVQDLRAALDALYGLGFTHGAVAIGLCSGAYNALMAAAEDSRIRGVLSGNPQFLSRQAVLTKAALNRFPGFHLPVRRPDLEPPAPGAERPRAPRWVVALRGLKRVARRTCPRPLRDRLRGAGPEERRTRAFLRGLTGRGCAVHLVYSEGDIGHIRLHRAFGERPRLPPGASVTMFQGTDHVFGARRDRERFLDLALAFGLEMAAASAAPPPLTSRPEIAA